MGDIKFDRTAFKAQTAAAAANHDQYYKDMTLNERLNVLNYLNSIAYNYPEGNPPRMDRTAFSMRKHKK